MANEVQAARRAWPAIATGLPASPSAALRKLIEEAVEAARQLAQPQFMANASRLTGPAAGLAGLYEEFIGLAQHGWMSVEAAVNAIADGPERAARFAQANSFLYVYFVYDSHFDLSLASKTIAQGYKRLGGSPAFGAMLGPAEIHALTHAYSIQAVRLTPHPIAQ